MKKQGSIHEGEIEGDIFKKCHKCKQRPASIRCGECLKESGAEMFCYSCNRIIHLNKAHSYTYATFNGS
jgi:hypothetical protein